MSIRYIFAFCSVAILLTHSEIYADDQQILYRATTALNVRNAPSKDGIVKVVLPKGTLILNPEKTGSAYQVNGISGEWLKVELDTPLGKNSSSYIFSGYLEKVNNPIDFYSCNGVAVVEKEKDSVKIICAGKKLKPDANIIGFFYDMTCKGDGLQVINNPENIFTTLRNRPPLTTLKGTKIYVDKKSNNILQLSDPGMPADFMGCKQ